MILKRWEPFDALTIRPALVNRIWNELASEPHEVDSEWRIPVDIRETDSKFEVTAALPGFSREEITVSLDGRLLAVRAVHPEPESVTDESGRYILRERKAGVFQRSVKLPVSVDADGVESTYRDGLLTVTLPKVAATLARQIEVKVA